MLDTRASEDHASDPSILDFSFDTEYPLSINDADLLPEATEFPKVQPGVSEMTFCLIRYEICLLTRKLTYVPPGATPCKVAGQHLTLEDKEKLVRDVSQHLEVTYLQYCEDAGPLYWVSATIARLIMAKMSLILYHPLTQPGKPNSLSQDIRDRLFMASIEIIEYSHVLESEASTKKWGWLFHTYIQWHAIAFILGELCTRGNSEITTRAWRALDVVFQDWGRAVTHTKSGMLWQPMRKLMAKARRKREENAQQAASAELGIPPQYMRPQPTAYSQPSPCPGNIARDRLLSNTTGPVDNGIQVIDSTIMTMGAPNTMQPQIVGMGSMAPEQIQLQMQYQQQQLQDQQPAEWMMDDGALLDLDMGTLDGEINWEGWDDMVRDFQMQQDNLLPDAPRPTLGGMEQWW